MNARTIDPNRRVTLTWSAAAAVIDGPRAAVRNRAFVDLLVAAQPSGSTSSGADVEPGAPNRRK